VLTFFHIILDHYEAQGILKSEKDHFSKKIQKIQKNSKNSKKFKKIQKNSKKFKNSKNSILFFVRFVAKVVTHIVKAIVKGEL